MASLENDGSNKQATGNDVQKEANIYEDEINLIDYFLVLWKRKWFVFIASVLPPLVVGLAIFIGPRDSNDNRMITTSFTQSKAVYDKIRAKNRPTICRQKLPSRGLSQYR